MRIYKYLTPARLDVLSGLSLRFTPASALNDPFELRPYFATFASLDELSRYMEENPVVLRPFIAQAYHDVGPPLVDNITESDFVCLIEQMMAAPEFAVVAEQGRREALARFQAITDIAREAVWKALTTHFGILSLSTIATHPLMWAHYGAQHSGIVIEFDGSHGFFNRPRSPTDDCYRLQPVSYRPRVPNMTLQELAEHKDVLYWKVPEWAYEAEVRMLAPLSEAQMIVDTPEGHVHLFQLPSEAVQGLILGARSLPSLEAAALTLLTSTPALAHVGMSKAILDDASGSIGIPPYQYPGRGV